MTINYARQQQIECAAHIIVGGPEQRGAALGMFDWFAEEFLMTFCAQDNAALDNADKQGEK